MNVGAPGTLCDSVPGFAFSATAFSVRVDTFKFSLLAFQFAGPALAHPSGGRMRVIPSFRAPLPPSALALALLLAGCTDKVPPPAPVVTTSETPDSVQAVFTARCAKAGCHVTGTAAFNEVLETGASYAATVNVPSGERPAFMR